jgi:hypothetical protein
MKLTKKIVLVLGLLGVAIGGYTLTKFLTRNVRKVKGFVIVKKTYDEAPTYEGY